MKLAERLILAGIKHCGKSSIGKALADTINVPFIDSDIELARECGTPQESIRKLYLRLGMEKFRKKEAELVSKLFAVSRVEIVALGGGVITNPYVQLELLAKSGRIIAIDVSDSIAEARVFATGIPAFLAGKENPLSALRQINAERRKVLRELTEEVFYPEINLSPHENALRLLDLLQKSE